MFAIALKIDFYTLNVLQKRDPPMFLLKNKINVVRRPPEISQLCVPRSSSEAVPVGQVMFSLENMYEEDPVTPSTVRDSQHYLGVNSL